jgi:hypothetical protein
MTAPIASLFMTPLDAGAQTAAPSAGATAGSDAVFDVLVSAFFQDEESAAAAPMPQAQSQQPQLPQRAEAAETGHAIFAETAITDVKQLSKVGAPETQRPNPVLSAPFENPAAEAKFRSTFPRSKTHMLWSMTCPSLQSTG